MVTCTFESQFNVQIITYITGCIVRLWNLKSRLRRAGHPEIHRVFSGKPEGKRPLGRLRHTWEDDI